MRTKQPHRLYHESGLAARVPDTLPAMPRLIVLVGPPGCGKTTVCSRLADAARAAGWRVAGILSPGTPGDPSGRRARLVVDLATGAARELGHRVSVEGALHWALDEEALAWGAGAARAGADGADLLIVDELGRLELDEERGWASVVDLLCGGTWRLAVAAVREEHVDALRTRLGASGSRLEIVRVDERGRDALPRRLIEDAR